MLKSLGSLRDDERVLDGPVVGAAVQDFQPSGFENLIPLRPGPLLSSNGCHHDEIQLARLSTCALVGDHNVIDDQQRVLGHGWDNFLEHLDAVVVGKTVQHVAEVVEFRIYLLISMQSFWDLTIGGTHP